MKFSAIEWTNSPSLRVLSSTVASDASRRRFLVFLVPNGSTKSPLLEIRPDQRNFDIAVRFYDAPGINRDLIDQTEFVMTGGLSKFHAAYLFINECDLLYVYDGVIFLDGDLEFDASQLSNFLSFVHAANLDLAQPSVTRDSYCYWKMAYHQPGYIFRQTSFVEVMAPYLSRAALIRALPTFTRSISTYGLDLVWPTLIGNDRIGVVDAFQIRHSEKVDHSAGKFYKYLKSIGVDLDEEERLILEEYGVVPVQAHSKRGFFLKRRAPFSCQAPQLGSVELSGPEKKTDKQLFIDLEMISRRWCRARSEEALTEVLLPFLDGNCISRVRK